MREDLTSGLCHEETHRMGDGISFTRKLNSNLIYEVGFVLLQHAVVCFQFIA